MTQGMGLGALFDEKMPYPDPFSYEERCTIEEAVRVGLARSIARNPALTESIDEVKITQALETELSSMMEDAKEPVPGFTSDVFETIVRGNELCDFKKEFLEKRPDLVLRRKKRPRRGMDFRYFGLFIECKVVDAQRTMTRYVLQGLARFVEGVYAWAVPVAMMVAYVDRGGGYGLPKTLDGYLRRHGKDEHKSEILLRDEAPLPAVYSTTHARSFSYLEGGAPGPIRVDHLWQFVR
jgi:hypothetical protein